MLVIVGYVSSQSGGTSGGTNDGSRWIDFPLVDHTYFATLVYSLQDLVVGDSLLNDKPVED